MVTAPEPSLMLVSDRRRTADGDLPRLAAAAARAGVDWIQVREKDLPDRELARLTRAVVRAIEGTPARVLVSGRPDVATVAGADGVQLPEEGLPVSEVKRSFPRLVVGASRHSVEGARRAEADGADLVLLGPIFATPGKEGRALGLDPLGDAACALRIPVHAIGGVSTETAGAACAAGARGLAAIRAFLQEDAAAAVRALRMAARAGAGGAPAA
jgi:thiamine-phosphate pyrophosphorylase